MKKTIITIAIVVCLCMTTLAEPNNGGLFQRGADVSQTEMERTMTNKPKLPSHGQTNNQSAPLGTGVVLLAGFGAMYALSKRRGEK